MLALVATKLAYSLHHILLLWTVFSPLFLNSVLSTENNVELIKHNSEDLKVYLGQISIDWWLNTM